MVRPPSGTRTSQTRTRRRAQAKRGTGGVGAAQAAVSAINARERRAKRMKKIIRWGVVVGVLLVLVGGATAGLVSHIASQVTLTTPKQRPTLSVTAADGTLLADYTGLISAPIPIADLPPETVNSFIAAMDPGFRDHAGATLSDITRIARPDVPPGTITMRLAARLFELKDESALRALEELCVALWLEFKFDKDRILEEFLTRAYVGDGIFGLDQAARRLFSRSPGALALKEAAAIAAAVEDPQRYNPLSSLRQADKRAQEIIEAMAGHRLVSRSVAKRAQRVRLKPDPDGRGAKADHYIGVAALERLAENVGYPVQSLSIRTTIDPALQRKAVRHLENVLSRFGVRKRINNAALIALRPSGEILAMAAGTRYDPVGRNRVTEQARQTGTLFSLYPYVLALKNGITPTDWVRDNPLVVDGWRPRNAGGKHFGQITLKDAFARGLLTVPAQFAEDYGIDSVIDTAREFGVSAPITARPQVVAGVDKVTLLEMAGAYAAIAAGGYSITPTLVSEVRKRNGEVLFASPHPAGPRVMAPEYAAQANQLLTTAMTTGIARGARLDRQAAGLTATTAGYRDAWFIGYTADMVTAVWLGNDNGKGMNKVYGRREAAQFWRGFMLDAHELFPIRTLNKGIQETVRNISNSGDS